MAISTVLVPLSGGGDAAALAAAFALATPFGGHVLALAASSDARAARTRAHAVFLAEAERAGAAVAERARRGGALTASFQDAAGTLADATEQAAIFADVIVFAPPMRDDAGRDAFLRALMQSGRLVLVAPSGTPVVPCRRIAVGWDGELAAARTLTACVPLFKRAAAVELVQLGAPDPSRIAASEAVAYLALHGVAAGVRTVSAGGPPGRALLAAAKAGNADLLIMGAYGHSRIVETIFGGATSEVVAHAAMPVLMLH